MKNRTWLFSWIAEADYRAAAADEAGGGPLAQALRGVGGVDRLILFSDAGCARAKAYGRWLQQGSGQPDLELQALAPGQAADYGQIHQLLRQTLPTPGLAPARVSVLFHLSPAAPALSAIWMLLAHGGFPARLIQTRLSGELQEVDAQAAGEFLAVAPQCATPERAPAAAPRGARAFAKIIHQSAGMARQLALARKMADFAVPVLILGESGTGKGLFAEALHAASPRAAQPFLAVHCGAMARDQVNSELFGHKRGAFAGAERDHLGLLVAADGGTLFLDQINALPLDTQLRLLRVLHQGEVTPLGGSQPIKVNVRLISASHADLAKEAAQGRFSLELFHSLAVGVLNLPALRQRPEDIALLTEHFMQRINQQARARPAWQPREIAAEARALLSAQAWPGNVRELYHTLLRAVMWSEQAQIGAADLQAAQCCLQSAAPAVAG